MKTARKSLERSEVPDHDLVFGNYTGRLALVSYFYSVVNVKFKTSVSKISSLSYIKNK